MKRSEGNSTTEAQTADSCKVYINAHVLIYYCFYSNNFCRDLDAGWWMRLINGFKKSYVILAVAFCEETLT